MDDQSVCPRNRRCTWLTLTTSSKQNDERAERAVNDSIINIRQLSWCFCFVQTMSAGAAAAAGAGSGASSGVNVPKVAHDIEPPKEVYELTLCYVQFAYTARSQEPVRMERSLVLPVIWGEETTYKQRLFGLQNNGGVNRLFSARRWRIHAGALRAFLPKVAPNSPKEGFEFNIAESGVRIAEANDAAKPTLIGGDAVDKALQEVMSKLNMRLASPVDDQSSMS